ncbi:MAG: cysteine desulfurase family protein, partial [Candidatus Saccharibacteria bacterium]|nr:cysteine desulfurase family protein [Candidatus Saccharibacteria bacterium]
MTDDIIYLDHAAATPMDPLVLAAMQPYFSEQFFNPSSPYAAAVGVKRAYVDAKARIARVLGVGADELVMTAGATESVNLALTAAGDGRCAVSAIEHASVIAAAGRGGEPVIIPADKKGRVTPEAVRAALTPEVSMVSVALVNHELGTVQAIDDIVRVVEAERQRRREAGEVLPLYVHTDASQAAALLDVKVKRLGVDLLTLSAAKVYGPKQVGLLWVRPGVRLSATVVGGGQEGGLRSGTENVAGVIGFATALELAAQRRSGEVRRLRVLRDRLRDRLAAALPDMIVSGDQKKGLVSILNAAFPGVDAERLVFWLEARGVMVATGSACAANAGLRSSVLTAIGLEPAAIDGSLRMSLGRLSTEANIDRAA